MPASPEQNPWAGAPWTTSEAVWREDLTGLWEGGVQERSWLEKQREAPA